MTEPDNPDLVVGDDGLARPAWAATDPLLREYYDTEWGMPVRDERGVFERLSLEAFQSGLRETGNVAGGLAGLVWSYRPKSTPRPHRLADIPTQSPQSAALSRELKRRGFRFVGPTTMHALMEAIGIIDTHLVGSHRRGSSGVWG